MPIEESNRVAPVDQMSPAANLPWWQFSSRRASAPTPPTPAAGALAEPALPISSEHYVASMEKEEGPGGGGPLWWKSRRRATTAAGDVNDWQGERIIIKEKNRCDNFSVKDLQNKNAARGDRINFSLNERLRWWRFINKDNQNDGVLLEDGIESNMEENKGKNDTKGEEMHFIASRRRSQLYDPNHHKQEFKLQIESENKSLDGICSNTTSTLPRNVMQEEEVRVSINRSWWSFPTSEDLNLNNTTASSLRINDVGEVGVKKDASPAHYSEGQITHDITSDHEHDKKRNNNSEHVGTSDTVICSNSPNDDSDSVDMNNLPRITCLSDHSNSGEKSDSISMPDGVVERDPDSHHVVIPKVLTNDTDDTPCKTKDSYAKCYININRHGDHDDVSSIASSEHSGRVPLLKRRSFVCGRRRQTVGASSSEPDNEDLSSSLFNSLGWDNIDKTYSRVKSKDNDPWFAKKMDCDYDQPVVAKNGRKARSLSLFGAPTRSTSALFNSLGWNNENSKVSFRDGASLDPSSKSAGMGDDDAEIGMSKDNDPWFAKKVDGDYDEPAEAKTGRKARSLSLFGAPTRSTSALFNSLGWNNENSKVPFRDDASLGPSSEPADMDDDDADRCLEAEVFAVADARCEAIAEEARRIMSDANESMVAMGMEAPFRPVEETFPIMKKLHKYLGYQMEELKAATGPPQIKSRKTRRRKKSSRKSISSTLTSSLDSTFSCPPTHMNDHKALSAYIVDQMARMHLQHRESARSLSTTTSSPNRSPKKLHHTCYLPNFMWYQQLQASSSPSNMIRPTSLCNGTGIAKCDRQYLDPNMLNVLSTFRPYLSGSEHLFRDDGDDGDHPERNHADCKNRRSAFWVEMVDEKDMEKYDDSANEGGTNNGSYDSIAGSDYRDSCKMQKELVDRLIDELRCSQMMMTMTMTTGPRILPDYTIRDK